jgi:transketolase
MSYSSNINLQSLSANNYQLANAIRILTIDAIEKANSGHPGMPMGMADVATVLFAKHLKYNPQIPDWDDRDRFVLSAGHGSMLIYALAYLTGYDLSLEEIKKFRQLGSKTAGHPEWGVCPGVETTTGPLGQGIANGVGMAIAEKILNTRFGNDLVDHETYILAGDGCFMEGITQEAISLAGHLKLNKLTLLFDDNGVSIDGKTNITISEDVALRFHSNLWEVITIDGHNYILVMALVNKELLKFIVIL